MINNTDKLVITILLPLMALIAPFLVWLIELILPYPYIVEELIKVVFVFYILNLVSRQKQIQLAILIGLLFSLSETILYFFNFSQLSSPLPLLVKRFLLTSAMHSLTMIVILLPTFINKKLIFLGVVFAVLIHYFYNFGHF